MLFDMSEEGNFEVLAALGLILLVRDPGRCVLVGFRVLGPRLHAAEDRDMSKLVLTRRRAGASAASTAVDGLRPELQAGEFVSLLGPVRLRQDHDAAHDRGLHRRRPRARSRWTARCSPRPPASLPPEKRSMSMIFQSYAIWPNMTVAQNVGLRPRGAQARRATRSGAGSARSSTWCRWATCASRYPAELSRRPAAARGAGPRHRGQARGAAARRAAVQPRRQPARGDALRDPPPARRVPASPRSTSPTTRPRRW